jgi:hypothetical protein
MVAGGIGNMILATRTCNVDMHNGHYGGLPGVFFLLLFFSLLPLPAPLSPIFLFFFSLSFLSTLGGTLYGPFHRLCFPALTDSRRMRYMYKYDSFPLHLVRLDLDGRVPPFFFFNSFSQWALLHFGLGPFRDGMRRGFLVFCFLFLSFYLALSLVRLVC